MRDDTQTQATPVSGAPVPLTGAPVTEAPLTPAPADESSAEIAGAPITVALVAPADHCGPAFLPIGDELTRFDRVGGVFSVPDALVERFEALGFTRA